MGEQDARTTEKAGAVQPESAEAARPEGAGGAGGDGAEATWSEAARPIRRSDSLALAEQFYRRFPVSMIRLEHALWELLDHGEIVSLTTEEHDALADHLTDLHIKVWIECDKTVDRQLASAVKKLAFAHGRHYGLMNIDMGIKPDEEVRRGR